MTTNEVRKAIKDAGLKVSDYNIQNMGLGRIEVFLNDSGISDNARQSMTSEPIISKMIADSDALLKVADAVGGEFKTTYVLVH